MEARGAEAQATFVKNCGPCHGPDGKAKTPVARRLGVKDLTVSTIPESEIVRQIREGKKGPQGKPLMPSFKESLSEEEIKALVGHVLKLRK